MLPFDRLCAPIAGQLALQLPSPALLTRNPYCASKEKKSTAVWSAPRTCGRRVIRLFDLNRHPTPIPPLTRPLTRSGRLPQPEPGRSARRPRRGGRSGRRAPPPTRAAGRDKYARDAWRRVDRSRAPQPRAERRGRCAPGGLGYAMHMPCTCDTHARAMWRSNHRAYTMPYHAHSTHTCSSMTGTRAAVARARSPSGSLSAACTPPTATKRAEVCFAPR